MPRRVTLVLTGALVAVTPTAAQAADTYTVDGSAAAGCSAAKVCKTLTDAVAAVANGDTINVIPGIYKEPGKVTLTKTGVTIKGTPAKTTVYPAVSAATGDPTITLAQGDTLDGITVATAVNAGPAVLVMGRDTTFRNGAILRLSASTVDGAAYAVDSGVAAGTSTIQAATIVNGPAGQTGKSAPAVQGNGTSSLAISDAFVLSGAGTGPALGLTGNDKAGSEPVNNTVVRATLIAQGSAADAVTITSAASDPLKKGLAMDSVALLPGRSGVGLRAVSTAGMVPGNDTAGDIRVLAHHVTIAGGDKPFAVAAGSAGAPAKPAGNIAVTLDRSIVHGATQGTVSSAAAQSIGTAPLLVPLSSANTATVVVSNSDTTQNAVGAAGDKATVTVQGKTTTPDDRLFVNLAKLDTHLRQDAPVIDKGGPVGAGESDRDVDGQPRATNGASDLGADEFVNRAPIAAATVSPTTVAPDTDVTFDASGSKDPEAASGGGIATYRWTFGDGTSTDTVTPTTVHRYTAPGTYATTLTVVDNAGAASAPLTLPAVGVRDLTPPAVTLTSPMADQVFRVFVTRTTRTASGRKRTVKTLDRRRLVKVRFAGKATDASGIASVQLSVRRVSKAATKTCVFLDGKTTFASASCTKPRFFLVRQTAGVFSYRFKSKLKPRAGLYEVTVRATDAGGVVATSAPVRFGLK